MDSMKAAINQLPGVEPGERTIAQAVKQASQSTASTGGGSELWGQLRRLKAQLGQIELTLTGVKRDVARIDRKQYREAKDAPPSETPHADIHADSPHPDGLFN